jgi:uncharacterized membrane protein
VGTAPRSARSQSAGLPQNVAGLLCWLLPIPASVFFLVAEPYKSNKFIGFHAWQSLFTLGAAMALGIGLMIVGMVLTMVFAPFGVLFLFIWWVFFLALAALAIFMAVKAFTNQSPELPLLGELASKQSSM